MARDAVTGSMDEAELVSDPISALPDWAGKERRLAHMLPYVSLVAGNTIRTRGNELMQCIRLEGVNSTTSEDSHLDRIGALLAGVVSAISTLGTVWRDCLAEGLRLIFIPVGVEDDEEPKDRASETRDDQGPCRASREGHPACDAQVAFF